MRSPPASGRVGPDRATAIASRALELFEWCAEARAKVEDEWRAADEAFYNLGPTHVDPIQRELRDTLNISLPPPRIHARVGLTYPVTVQQVSAICGEPVRFRVAPRGDELTQQIAAYGGQALCDYWKDRLKLAQQYEAAAYSLLLHNVAWFGFGWNPYAGSPDPAFPGERTGEVFIRARSAWEIYPDPSSVFDEDMGFLFDVQRLSPFVVPKDVRDFAREQYGQGSRGGAPLLSAEEWKAKDTLERYGRSDAETDLDGMIEISHLHVRPSAGVFEDERERLNEKDDEGLHVILVNGATFRLLPGAYTKQGIDIPYSSARFCEDVDRRYSAGNARVLYTNDVVLSDLTNKNLAHQKYARRSTVISRPDADLKGRLTPEVTELIETDDPEGVKYFQVPPVTSADLEVPRDLVSLTQDLVGNPSVWFGRVGPNMETASQYAQARSGSELRMARLREHLRNAFRDAVQGDLVIAADFYSEGRMIETVGPSYPVRQMVIDGEGLSALKVELFDDPVLPTNTLLRVEALSRISSMFPPGFLSPKKVYEWLRLPQSETQFFDLDELNRSNAHEMCWRVLRGEVPPEAVGYMKGIEDDEIFIDAEKAWLLSALGKEARIERPDAWKAIAEDLQIRLFVTGAQIPPGAGGGQPGLQEGLTQPEGGVTGPREMGQPRTAEPPMVEGMLGRMPASELGAEANEVLGSRERVMPTNGRMA